MVDSFNSHMDVLIKSDRRFWLKQEKSFIPHLINMNEETTIAWWVFLIQCLILCLVCLILCLKRFFCQSN